MPYYEIIYETGSHSVAFYADDEEANRALKAHHDRAKSGQSGTPASTERMDLTPSERAVQPDWVAERVKRVLVYDYHPGDYAAGGEVSKDDALKLVGKGDTVNVDELRAKLAEAVDPHKYDENAGRHDSLYKMPESRELSWTE